MNREEKSAAIEQIAAQIEASEAIFAIDYRGISVTQAAELRSQLREADASFRVVKNRLTKIAAEKVGEERLAELLSGPTALTFVRGDTAQAAKAITTFNKEHEVLTFKGGFMATTTLDEESFKAIARLPGRDVLNGQLAGIVASPLTGLVRGLGSMIQGLALQLGQIAEKGLVTGEAPAAAPAEASEPAESAEPAAEANEAAEPAAEASEAAEPAAEANEASDEPADADEQPDEGDAGPADAPAEEAPTEAASGNEPPAEDDPSKAEGEDDASSADASADDNASEQDSNEEEG